jgi:hypothetical protein
MRGAAASASMQTTRRRNLMAATVSKRQPQRSPRAGDRLVIRAHRQGQAERDGEILEVLGTDRVHYRVRWTDYAHESVVYPGEDVYISRVRG